MLSVRARVRASQSAEIFGDSNLRDDFQVQPLAVDGAHLMYAPIITVQEVASIGNRTGVKRANITLRPTSRAHAPAVLANFRRGVDAVLNLVLNTGGSGGDQPSAAFDLGCLGGLAHGL